MENTQLWLIDYEIRNIIIKIKDYKYLKDQSINYPAFQKLFSQTIYNKLTDYDEIILNLIKLEELDDFIYIAIIHSINKIFSSIICDKNYMNLSINNLKWLNPNFLSMILDEISKIIIQSDSNTEIFAHKRIEVFFLI